MENSKTTVEYQCPNCLAVTSSVVKRVPTCSDCGLPMENAVADASAPPIQPPPDVRREIEDRLQSDEDAFVEAVVADHRAHSDDAE